MPLQWSGDCGLQKRIQWRYNHGWRAEDIAENLDVLPEVIETALEFPEEEPSEEDLATMNANLGNLADDEPWRQELGSSGEWAVDIYHSPWWDDLQMYSIRLPLGTDHFAWVYCGASEEGQPGQSDDFDPDLMDPQGAAVSLVGESGFERLLSLRVYYTPT